MTLASAVRGSWHQFLEAFEGLRPELYRYCRHLTRSPWDAEDLAQDVLARAFVTLGKLGAAPPNPRAWLFRVASNAWIDQQRRPRGTPERESTGTIDPRSTREVRARDRFFDLARGLRCIGVVLRSHLSAGANSTAEFALTAAGTATTLAA